MMNSKKRLLPWKTLTEREVFSAQPWFSISVQKIELPDGRVVDDFYRIHLPETAAVFALTDNNKVILLRNYKHGFGRVCYSFPGGIMHRDENALEAARRELLEETGYEAPDWLHLGSFVPHSNYGCGKFNFYLAHHARQVRPPDSGDLEEMDLSLLDMDEVVTALKTGEIVSMSGAALVGLASLHFRSI